MKLKNLVIALVLNLFALPGAGHWYLGRRRRALIFILILVMGFGFFFYDLILALKGAALTVSIDDPATQVLALTQGIVPNLEPYLIGLFLIIILSSLDIIWIFLSQVAEKKS